MTSSSPAYHEDFYTLQEMTEHFEFSEQLIRQIQKHGFMLPEMVKFGSAEIEIYSTLDQNMCRRVTEDLKKDHSLSHAIAAAQEHVIEVYRHAHGEESIHMNNSPDLGQLAPAPRRKKLYMINELLEAVDISEERFREIRQHIQFVPLRLLIPGKTIEYYGEDDYLRLRLIVTLLSEGYPLETACDGAYRWGMSELC